MELTNELMPEEPEIICYCSNCKGEIYAGELMGEDCGLRYICLDCVNELFAALPADMRFELLGFRAVKALSRKKRKNRGR